MIVPGPALDAARQVVDQAAVDAGRDPKAIGMEAWVKWQGSADDVVTKVGKWTDVGATHISINTMGAGLKTVDDHLAALAAVAEVLPKV